MAAVARRAWAASDRSTSNAPPGCLARAGRPRRGRPALGAHAGRVAGQVVSARGAEAAAEAEAAADMGWRDEQPGEDRGVEEGVEGEAQRDGEEGKAARSALHD